MNESVAGQTVVLEGVVCSDAAQYGSGSPRVAVQPGHAISRWTASSNPPPLYSFGDVSPGTAGSSRRQRPTTPKTATPPVVHPEPPEVNFEIGKIYDLKPGVIGFACFTDKKQALSVMRQHTRVRFFTSEFHAEYHPFAADFGPVDLHVIFKFCELVQGLMDTDALQPNKKPQSRIYYFGDAQADIVNSFLLLGCFAIAHLGMSNQDTYRAFRCLRPCPFPAYRDSGPGKKSTFDVTLQDCLFGFAVAQSNGWLSARASVQLADYVRNSTIQ